MAWQIGADNMTATATMPARQLDDQQRQPDQGVWDEERRNGRVGYGWASPLTPMGRENGDNIQYQSWWVPRPSGRRDGEGALLIPRRPNLIPNPTSSPSAFPITMHKLVRMDQSHCEHSAQAGI